MQEITAEMIREKLPPIGADYSKFDRGRLFLAAGSYGMAGAAVLAGRAAMRAGVGYLDMLVPESIYPIVTAAIPEAVCTVYREDDPEALRIKIREGVKKATAAAAGPGLGKNRSLVMPALLGTAPEKLLLDADGLNYLSEQGASALPAGISELLLTPHTGEMGRLLQMNRSEVEKDRFSAVSRCAREFHACALLKGRNTLISDPEGHVRLNPTGNAGLARAGKIQHEPVAPHRLLQRTEVIKGNLSVVEDIGRHDHMAGARLKPAGRVLRGDAASGLQRARISRQRTERLLPGCLIVGRVRRIEKDHMSAAEPVPAEQRRIPVRVMLGYVVLFRLISEVPERAPDDLLDLSVMNVDAWPKSHRS